MGLMEIIEVAQRSGIINTREAVHMLHPLQDHEKKVSKLFQNQRSGFREKAVEDLQVDNTHDEALSETSSHSECSKSTSLGPSTYHSPLMGDTKANETKVAEDVPVVQISTPNEIASNEALS